MNQPFALAARSRLHATLGALLCAVACTPPTSAPQKTASSAELRTAPTTAGALGAAASAGTSVGAAGRNAAPTTPVGGSAPAVIPQQPITPTTPMAGSSAPPAAVGGRPALPMIAAGAPASTPGANMVMTPRAGTAATAPTAGAGSADDPMMEMLRQTCVDTINMYRATKMLPPMARKMDQETCSDGGAKKDGDSMMGHSSAFGCRGPTGQNSCPGYPVGGFGGATLADTLKTCLKQMWAEGEPPVSRAECQRDTAGCFHDHGHYLNMTGSFKAVACGFYKMKNGNWWMNQDFF